MLPTQENLYYSSQPRRDNSQCLNLGEGAAFLGVCYKTLAKWRELGIVQGFYLPGERVSRPAWRVHIDELMRAIIEEGLQTPRRFIDPRTVREMPVCMISRLTGLSEQAVHSARSRGRLSDYTFESVHKWLLQRERRRLRAQERQTLIERYEKRLSVLRVDISRLRRKLQSERCAQCRKNPILRKRIAGT